MKLAAVGTSCVVLGAGAGTLLNASAAPAKKAAKTAAAKKKHAHKKGALGGKLIKRAVHADLTVATKDGFKTVTIDRGTLTAVSGNQLTIDESTKQLTNGKTVTVTVPAGARIKANRKTTTLAGLKAGQRVTVASLPKQTVVRAFDKKK